MYPVLFDGDVVKVRKTSASRLRTNDIICFKAHKKLVTHRIVYAGKNYVITRGDYAFQGYEKVPFKNILGRVESYRRNGITCNIDDIYLVQSSLYFNEIIVLGKLLKEKKIDFVVLKGLPLHLYVEKKHPRRLYMDCDILISSKSRTKVKRILENLGYTKIVDDFSGGEFEHKGRIIEESFLKNISSYPVKFDVHYEAAFLLTQIGNLENIYPQKLIKEFSKNLLRNKQNVAILGKEIPILSNEHQVLYLALHLMHHNFRGGYRYELLDKVLGKHFDIDRVFTDIRRFKLDTYIYASVRMLDKYYPSAGSKEMLRLLSASPILGWYVEKHILNTNIFRDEERVKEGIQRFLRLFFLSPQPFIYRVLVLGNEEVLGAVFWVLKSNCRRVLYGILIFLKSLFPSSVE